MAYAGGTAPDVVYVNLRQLRNYASQGFLRPLGDLIAQNPDTLDRVQARIKERLTIDGKIYSVPYAQYVQALYYRKDLFRAAGLNPNQPPKDWDEFYTYAQKLTDPQKGQYGFTFEQGSESYYWINFLWQAGGDISAKDAMGKELAAFNTPEGIDALQFYRKLLLGTYPGKDGKTQTGVANRTSTRKADISAGKIGMWFAYQSDDVANMNQFDLNPSLLGVAAMPKGPTGISGNEINAGMWGINAAVKDPEKLAACWQFIRYMASEEAAKIRCTAYVENGLAQLVNPNELQRWGYDEYITPIQRPWMEASKSLFASGKPEPNGPNMAFIYNLMNEPLDQAILYPKRDAKQILDASVAKINTKLLNYTPPAELAKQRAIAYVIFGAIVLGVTVLVGRTIHAALRVAKLRSSSPLSPRPFPPSEGEKGETDAGDASLPGTPSGSPFSPSEGGKGRGDRGAINWRVHLSAWAFMLPAVLSIAVWAYLPLLRGLVMAFQDVQILGNSRFVGLDNFIEAAGQETFRIGMKNAFLFTAYLLTLGFFLPVVIALLLNEIPKGKTFFRVLYYLPAVTTSVVTAMLFRQFFDPSPNGLANTLIGVMGWEPLKWLQDPALAMFSVVVPIVWASAGPGSVIYLAALQSIPDEMYEAADLDGAGFWTKIFRVTLPTLSPLLIINLVGATVAAFKIMEPVLVQTGGGPDYATHTVGLEIWQNAFIYLKFGYATAAALIMGSLLIGLTMYQLRVLQNVRFAAGNR